MSETIERPVLGTTEAAVRSCVNLIALATHTDEEHLAYWLDLYYQTRVAHERRPLPMSLEEYMGLLDYPRVKNSAAEKDAKDVEILESVNAGSLAAQKKTEPR